uniref:Serpentine receptor class gamma n=1 Tax=Caenorhabditis tropicalis TaxID=1561998 RepID=A0A1I7U1J4_9PELO
MPVQFWLGIASNYTVLIAIVLLFETRSSLIQQNRFRIKTTVGRISWVLVNFWGIMASQTPMYFDIPNQMDAKMFILKSLPCPTIEFFTEPNFVMTIDPFWENYIHISGNITFLCLTLQILFFTSCCIYYLFISKTMSQYTRRLQIRSFYLMIIQTVIPILLIFVPLSALMNKEKDG